MTKQLSIEEVKNLFPAGLSARQTACLIHFVTSGQLLKSCKAAGIHWTTHYLWKKRNKKYLAAFHMAEQMAADFMEDEIHRRAFEGFDHPVTFEGKITDSYKVYSDNLAMFRLKKVRPEYRDSFNFAAFNGPVQLNYKFDSRIVDPLSLPGKQDDSEIDYVIPRDDEKH